MARNCGECLINAVEIVELAPDGKCPRCGCDYGQPIGDETMPVIDYTPPEHAHPSFHRAHALTEPLRSHFPKRTSECKDWQPMMRSRALSSRVLVVARTRIECAWAAYIDAVPGMNHRLESEAVLDHGAKLDERIARILFPEFDTVPYAG